MTDADAEFMEHIYKLIVFGQTMHVNTQITRYSRISDILGNCGSKCNKSLDCSVQPTTNWTSIHNLTLIALVSTEESSGVSWLLLQKIPDVARSGISGGQA